MAIEQVGGQSKAIEIVTAKENKHREQS